VIGRLAVHIEMHCMGISNAFPVCSANLHTSLVTVYFAFDKVLLKNTGNALLQAEVQPTSEPQR